MRDAALVQLNGAHMADELTWEPLAAATACGPAASDEEVRDKILAVLEWAQHLIPDISEYSRGRKGYFQIWDP